MRLITLSVLMVAASINALVSVAFILWAAVMRLLTFLMNKGVYAASSHAYWLAKGRVPAMTLGAVLEDIAEDCTAMIQGVVWSIGAVAVSDCSEDEEGWASGETGRVIQELHKGAGLGGDDD